VASAQAACVGDDAYRKALLRRIDGLQQDKNFLQDEVKQLRVDLGEARRDLSELSQKYFRSVRETVS
jgi:predicted  nucleic acid-binding Zn-ribbon protein